MTKAPNVFARLALQNTCRAINNLETETLIRQQMSQTIEELNKLIAGSKIFIKSFSGLVTKLVVLPEYFLTSFPMGESIPEWRTKACIEMNGPEYQRMGDIARNRGVYLSGNA